MVQTADGGYAITGYVGYVWYADAFLYKIDKNGNLQWNRTYGGSGGDFGECVIQTKDGGYAIAGYSNSYGTGDDNVTLFKTDSSGNLQWVKTYGGPSVDEGFSIVQTLDGGFAIAGWTYTYTPNGADVYLVRTDINGNMLWSKTFGGNQTDEGHSLVQTTEGGFAIAGMTYSYAVGRDDMYLIKTDGNGNMQWNKTFGGAEWEYGWSVVQTRDGGYAVAGQTDSFGAGDSDMYLVKVNNYGYMEWQKTYGDSGWDGAYSMVLTSDDGFALAGLTQSFDSDGDSAYLVKTDRIGNQEWQKTYRVGGYNTGKCIVETSDGGYAIAGYTYYSSVGDIFDILLVKSDAQGEFGLVRVDTTANAITLYRGVNDIYWNYVRVRIWKIN